MLFQKIAASPQRRAQFRALRRGGSATVLMVTLWSVGAATAQEMRYKVHVRSWNGQYLVAERGGGAEVHANRYQARQWETFTLIDRNGGNLMSGDRVHFQTYDGWHYLMAENGGGGYITARRTEPDRSSTFRIQKAVLDVSGGNRIQHGAQIVLQADTWGHFLRAENGGGGSLFADRTYPREWETFTILFDFSTEYNDMWPAVGERPLLVVLAGNPVLPSDTSLYSLKNDGAIHREIVDTPGREIQVVLRASSGHYLVAEHAGGGDVNANRTSPSIWETFTLVDIDGGQLESGDQVRLRTWDGRHYVTAKSGGGGIVRADERAPVRGSTFIVRNAAGARDIRFGDRLSLQTEGFFYVSAEGGGGAGVHAKSRLLQTENVFRMLMGTPNQEIKVHFKTGSGHYVVAENYGGGAVKADSRTAASRETFTLVDADGGPLVSGDAVFLRTTDGHYMVASGGGGGDVDADRDIPDRWETFFVQKVGGGGEVEYGDRVAVRTWTGHFLSAENGGGADLHARSTQLGPFETFVFEAGGRVHSGHRLPTAPGLRSHPVVADTPDGNIRMLFALDANGYIHQTILSATEIPTHVNEMWRDWWQLPGSIRFQAGPAVINAPDGAQLHVFAVGVDGLVYEISYTRGAQSRWGGWKRLPQSRRFKDSPAVILTPDHRQLTLFATGQDGYVYQRSYTFAAAHWGDWEPIPGTKPFQAGPAAANLLDGRMLGLFATDLDGRVHHKVYDRTHGYWKPWVKIGGAERFSSGPALLTTDHGQEVMLYVLGQDGRIYESTYPSKLFEEDSFFAWMAFWTKWRPLKGQGYQSRPAPALRMAPKKDPSYYRDLLFGPANSLRGYFLENSYGKFTFKEAFMTPWLPQHTPPGQTQEETSAQIVRLVEQHTSFQFRDYDANHDGRVTQDELSILWIFPDFNESNARARGFTPKEVEVPSMRGQVGVDVGSLPRVASFTELPTILHEVAHAAFNLVDLYPDGGTSSDVGDFSLMSRHDVATHLDPFTKMKLGWIRPRVVTRDGWYSLRDVESHPEILILHSSKGTEEYFILENRFTTGSYEDALAVNGLAIWRIEETHESYGRDGMWGRKSIHLVSPLANALTLWDVNDPTKSYPWTPTSTPSSSMWGNGSASGFSLYRYGQGDALTLYVDVPESDP